MLEGWQVGEYAWVYMIGLYLIGFAVGNWYQKHKDIFEDI